jgi:hypothetical protein
MAIWQVHNNEGTIYIDASKNKIRELMCEYVKAKRDKGIPLTSIIYTYNQIRIQHRR